MYLDEVKPGQQCVVEEVNGVGLLRKRLLEMGLTPNTVVKVRESSTDGRSD